MPDQLLPPKEIKKFCPQGTHPFNSSSHGNTGKSSDPDDLQRGEWNTVGAVYDTTYYANQVNAVGLCLTHILRSLQQSGIAAWVEGMYHPLGAVVLHNSKLWKAKQNISTDAQQAAEPVEGDDWGEFNPSPYHSAADLPWDTGSPTPTTKDKHNQDIGNLQQVIAGRYGDNIPMEAGGQTIKQVVDGITPGPGQEVNSDHVLMSPVDPDNPKTLTEYRDNLNTDEMVVVGAEANLLLTTELNRLRSVTQNAPFISGDVADQVLAIDFTALSLPALIEVFGPDWYKKPGIYQGVFTEGTFQVFCLFFVVYADGDRYLYINKQEIRTVTWEPGSITTEHSMGRLVFSDPDNDPVTDLTVVFSNLANSNDLLFAGEVNPGGQLKSITDKVREVEAEIPTHDSYPVRFDNTYNYLEGDFTLQPITTVGVTKTIRTIAKVNNTNKPISPINPDANAGNLDIWKIIGKVPVYRNDAGLEFGTGSIESPDGVGTEVHLFDFTAAGSFAGFVDHEMMVRLINSNQVDKVEIDFNLTYRGKTGPPFTPDINERRTLIVNPVRSNLTELELNGRIILPGVTELHTEGEGFHASSDMDFLHHSIVLTPRGMYWRVTVCNQKGTEMNYVFNIILHGITYVGIDY